ncbi:hypothetical protein ACFL08_03405 [Patescibacteria group bacterium]
MNKTIGGLIMSLFGEKVFYSEKERILFSIDECWISSGDARKIGEKLIEVSDILARIA